VTGLGRSLVVTAVDSNLEEPASGSGSSSSSDEGCEGRWVWRKLEDPLSCQFLFHALGELMWCCKPSKRCAFFFAFGIITILTGIVLGVYVEGWSLVSTLYFLMQVVTTIGYGDVTVSSEGTKLFMSFYVLCVLVMFSHLLNLFVQAWLKKHVELMQSFWEVGRANSCLQEFKPVLASSVILAATILAGTVFYRAVEPCECVNGNSLIEGCNSFSLETCKQTGGYQKTFIDCFYMSVITVTTVGFGDHSPRSEEGRAFGIVWCVIGVGCCLNWLRTVTELLVEKHRWQQFSYRHMRLDEKIFREMDLEGTGYLTRHEYLGYALIKHGLISKGIIDYLNAQFDDMDPRGTDRVTYQQLKNRQLAANEAATLRHAQTRRWWRHKECG